MSFLSVLSICYGWYMLLNKIFQNVLSATLQRLQKSTSCGIICSTYWNHIYYFWEHRTTANRQFIGQHSGPFINVIFWYFGNKVFKSAMFLKKIAVSAQVHNSFLYTNILQYMYVNIHTTTCKKIISGKRILISKINVMCYICRQVVDQADAAECLPVASPHLWPGLLH